MAPWSGRGPGGGGVRRGTRGGAGPATNRAAAYERQNRPTDRQRVLGADGGRGDRRTPSRRCCAASRGTWLPQPPRASWWPAARPAAGRPRCWPAWQKTRGSSRRSSPATSRPTPWSRWRRSDLTSGSTWPWGRTGATRPTATCWSPVALGRLAALRGVDLAPEDAWVIGDTPRDLECARAGGARCLLVATGRYGFEELAALGPDAVVEDLADASGVVKVLTGDL